MAGGVDLVDKVDFEGENVIQQNIKDLYGRLYQYIMKDFRHVEDCKKCHEKLNDLFNGHTHNIDHEHRFDWYWSHPGGSATGVTNIILSESASPTQRSTVIALPANAESKKTFDVLRGNQIVHKNFIAKGIKPFKVVF